MRRRKKRRLQVTLAKLERIERTKRFLGAGIKVVAAAENYLRSSITALEDRKGEPTLAQTGAWITEMQGIAAYNEALFGLRIETPFDAELAVLIGEAQVAMARALKYGTETQGTIIHATCKLVEVIGELARIRGDLQWQAWLACNPQQRRPSQLQEKQR